MTYLEKLSVNRVSGRPRLSSCMWCSCVHVRSASLQTCEYQRTGAGGRVHGWKRILLHGQMAQAVTACSVTDRCNKRFLSGAHVGDSRKWIKLLLFGPNVTEEERHAGMCTLGLIWTLRQIQKRLLVRPPTHLYKHTHTQTRIRSVILGHNASTSLCVCVS